MGRKVEKTRAGATWTEARFHQFIRSGLRMLWQKWPVKWQVLAEARRPSTLPDKRIKWEYCCKKCGGWFLGKDVQVDHIVPAGTLKRLEDLPDFVSKLLVEKEGLQVLCTTCHNLKTQEERT